MRSAHAVHGVLGAVAMSTLMVPVTHAEAAAAAEPDRRGSWAQVTDILARVQPPTFPDRSFRVTEYGAVGDGVTECREAFEAAIRDCEASRRRPCRRDPPGPISSTARSTSWTT